MCRVSEATTDEVLAAARRLLDAAASVSDPAATPSAARVAALEGIDQLRDALIAALRGEGDPSVSRHARVAMRRAEKAIRMVAP